MGFLDYILAGFGVYEIKEENQKQPFKKQIYPQKPQSTSFTPTKDTISTHCISQNSSKMAFFCPKTTDQVIEIAKFLSSNQPAMVDTTHLPANIFQNSLDFLIGAKTALNASLKKLDGGLLVFVPKGTQLVEFLEE